MYNMIFKFCRNYDSVINISENIIFTINYFSAYHHYFYSFIYLFFYYIILFINILF